MKKILFIIMFLFLIGCKKEEPIIAVSFDTEYPYGIGLPEGFTELQKQEVTPSKEQWIGAVKRIDDMGVKNNIRFQFNIVGKTARDSKELIKKLALNHDISCHTLSHKNQLELDYEEKLLEIRSCKEEIEGIIGKKIKGNRFPYTKHDKDSFKALKEAGYGWDSSVWKDKSSLRPYNYQEIVEYPINPITDDWDYFVKKGNKDAEQFFNLLEQDIRAISPDSVYVIILHPWVLATDEERLEALEGFIERHKNIKSIDETYKG